MLRSNSWMGDGLNGNGLAYLLPQVDSSSPPPPLSCKVMYFTPSLRRVTVQSQVLLGCPPQQGEGFQAPSPPLQGGQVPKGSLAELQGDVLHP